METALIVELARRLTRQVVLGKGIYLNSESLALLGSIGAVGLVQEKSAELLRAQCEERVEKRHRSTNEESTVSPSETIFSTSPGTTNSDEGAVAFQRMQVMLQKPSKRSTGTTSKTHHSNIVRLADRKSGKDKARS